MGKDEPNPEQKPDEKPADKPELEAKPWFDKYGVGAEDTGVYGKYKDEVEAIKSIVERERILSQSVPLPKAKAKPEERAKQVREILGRLGALDDPAKYRELLVANLPDDLKDKVPEEDIEAVSQSAFEDGILPETFLKSVKSRVGEIQGVFAEKAKEDRARLEQEKKKLEAEKEDDRWLGEIWGRDKTTRVKDAETFARHYDDTLFALDNLPDGHQHALTSEQRAEGGGHLFRLLKQVNSPHLYRVFADLQQRIFGEGRMRDHSTPPAVANRQQQILETLRKDYGILGEERLAKYARNHAGQPSA